MKIEQFETIVPAPSGKQKRKVYVYLPQKYDGKKRFPVLYMFDGQTVFFDKTAPYGDSWRMGETLDRLKGELIVAAVECDKKERLSEYSPFPFDCEGYHSDGKGEQYLQWLVNDFKPMIDKKYCTLSDRANTFIAGSSMGGLMTVFALCRFPTIFIGGASLSPSFWVDEQASLNMIKSIESWVDNTLYLDMGELELAQLGGKVQSALESCLAALRETNIKLTYKLIPGGKHNEKSWRKQVPSFLRVLGLIK